MHDSPGRLALAITGGGSGAIGRLLERPGASRTLLEAIVPYSSASLRRYLGAVPEQYCSDVAARAMAMVAWRRAVELSTEEKLPPEPAMGVACTASLASDRPKRSPHRLHVALQTEGSTVQFSLELAKGLRSRRREEQLCAAVILNAIAEGCGLQERCRQALAPSETIVQARVEAPAVWRDLLAGRTRLAPGEPLAESAVAVAPARERRAIFAGAYNPRHAGHRRMADVAAQILGCPVEHEISVDNVDKPSLDYLEMEARAGQFVGERLWFTRAATFVEKAELFPGATFVVGADTILRIADARYYGSPADCLAAIARLASAGATFLVFGREEAGQFHSLADLPLPESLRALCQEASADLFRMDISSTRLRREAQAE